ncbi:uncharacterized protein B0H18DRAFT_1029115 [Fomitopsis serialis]|uniref:uncharacterized protein n=1 Tax=Fomitopsis serialis TaxID=139415 RepID=UPI002007BD38|nr:uncharacterized protein B0H18DRAFT_1029115 [Neoantrodia serialis]KAH9919089.1 hypothetical protein B0H18DRAFT_1029115 [Neoantrodia serialis]
MILHNDDDKKTDPATEPLIGSSSHVLPEEAPPPSFQESIAAGAGPSSALQSPYSYFNGNLADSEVYVPQGGEEPPPFTPYQAEFFVSGDSIVSHDRHLNEDGEALYRFLLSHAETPPTFYVHLRGVHTESRTRMVSRKDQDGQYRTHHEHYTEKIMDFDFPIDIGQHIALGPVHWSVPDEEPAYRGKMHREVDTGEFVEAGDLEGIVQHRKRRHASRKDVKMGKARRQERRDRGLPPWASLECEGGLGHAGAEVQHTRVLKSSQTLRQWADEYCASDKLLKEFTYEKVVYGWHLVNLQLAIEAAIKSTYYTGRLTVEFKSSSSKICVRPDNTISRTLSNKWVKLILILLLIYPFIWLYQRFGRRGGGRWEVCGGAYALKSWQLVDPSADPPPPFPGTASASDSRVVYIGRGTARTVGLREGEWFQRWEKTIRRAVTGRLKSTVALKEPDETTSAAMLLDGYRPHAII